MKKYFCKTTLLTFLLLIFGLTSLAWSYPVIDIGSPSFGVWAFGPTVQENTFETYTTLPNADYPIPSSLEPAYAYNGQGTQATLYNFVDDPATDHYVGFGNYVLQGDNELKLLLSTPAKVPGLWLTTNKFTVPEDVSLYFYVKYFNSNHVENSYYKYIDYNNVNQVYGYVPLSQFGAGLEELIIVATAPNIARIAIDNFGGTSNTPPVPEPATIMLLGAGLIGLGWIGRKKFGNDSAIA